MIFLVQTTLYLAHNIGSIVDNYKNAPQETEIESYVIGGIKQDVSDDTFADFKL